ncbi:fatty acid desaturase family protein [Hoeflea sp. YIM 152468]|uniref:fatty acid desaturase family protein n=1 Tax=Hoeflea sp. YIM 152468 TaxID=3031759 RepID=UPI0023DC5EFC|nr:fatty acid desaturase family protein [Hoeflea sp. YIM 152468]MDF1608466.1 fatty acid desaturase family protein [Hoeflea sp. YIM 152468]
MDHREFLASLTAAQRRELTRKSDGRGLMQLALHLGLIGLIAALIVARVPLWPLLMLPQGIVLVFLFTLLHEASHETPFRSRWLNTAAAHVSGLVILLPPRWFRYFHFAHHRHTQIPGKDPELAEPKPEGWADYIRYVSGIPVWISHVRTLVRNAAGRCADDFVPVGKRQAVRNEARTMLAVYSLLLAGSIAFASPVLVFVWLLPMLLGQPFLRLYLLAEHGRCAHVANMLENSRTTFTTAAVRRLAWNMPYHAEHHSYPAVPFHRLPDLHKLTAQHLRVTEKGYGRFHARYAPDMHGGAEAAK